jgi:hypothetical protein
VSVGDECLEAGEGRVRPYFGAMHAAVLRKDRAAREEWLSGCAVWMGSATFPLFGS